jgi:TPR repeat protein
MSPCECKGWLRIAGVVGLGRIEMKVRYDRIRRRMVKIITSLATLAMLSLPGTPLSAAPSDFTAGMEAYRTGDYRQAIEHLQRAADGGNAEAQFQLGAMYFNGHGVAQDRNEATRRFHDAAIQGNREAQYIVGMMYWDGRGVAKDFVSAYMWFDVASTNGNKQAAESGKRIAASLSSLDIAEAQRRARTCLESNYKRCD